MVTTNLILKQLGDLVNIYADNKLIGTVSNNDKNNGTIFQWKHPVLDKDVNITLIGVQGAQDEQTTSSNYFAKVQDGHGGVYGYLFRGGSLTVTSSSWVYIDLYFGDITTTTKYTKNESFILGKNQNELIMDYTKNYQKVYTPARSVSSNCNSTGFTGENYCTGNGWQGKGIGCVTVTEQGYPYYLCIN